MMLDGPTRVGAMVERLRQEIPGWHPRAVDENDEGEQ
jgi:hypothetical protein